MTDFFEAMTPLLKTYWYVAIISSIIFIVQTIFSFIGSDMFDTDFDIDVDDVSPSFHIFSFRNLINFLLGFSWSGIAFYKYMNPTLLIIVSVAIGFVFILIFFLIMKSLMKLSENNAFNIENTIDHNAEVYLTIPPNFEGKGKVLISVKGSVHELVAMTENKTELKSGNIVKVESIKDNQILIVSPI